MREREAQDSPPDPEACSDPDAHSDPTNPDLVNRNSSSLLGQSFLRRDSDGDESFFKVDGVNLSMDEEATFTRYSYYVTAEEMEDILTKSFSLDVPHLNNQQLAQSLVQYRSPCCLHILTTI